MDYRLQEEERQSKRLPDNIIEQVKIRTLGEIKNLLANLLASNNSAPVTVNTTFNNGNNNIQLSVLTNSKNPREMIYSGLLDVKQKMEACAAIQESTEVNGKKMKPSKLPDQAKAFHYIDPIISRYTGGKREGYFICWDLSDGYKYQYDIFEHKLTRTSTGATTSSPVQGD